MNVKDVCLASHLEHNVGLAFVEPAIDADGGPDHADRDPKCPPRVTRFESLDPSCRFHTGSLVLTRSFLNSRRQATNCLSTKGSVRAFMRQNGAFLRHPVAFPPLGAAKTP